MKVCTRCGELYEEFEVHDCSMNEPSGFLDKVKSKAPMFSKVLIVVGGAGVAATLLPAQVMTLVMSGVMIGGVWIYMLMKPLGERALDWMARHPKTFLLLHVPATIGLAMLGEGIILAFGNLLGGVLATAWLVQWGKKRGIASSGRPIPGKYISPPPPSKNGRLERMKMGFWKLAAVDTD